MTNKHTPAHKGQNFEIEGYPVTIKLEIDPSYLDENEIVNPDAEDIEEKLITKIVAAPELLKELEDEVKYLNRVAALIEDRNGKQSFLAEELAKPLRIRTLGLKKTIAKATGETK